MYELNDRKVVRQKCFLDDRSLVIDSASVFRLRSNGKERFQRLGLAIHMCKDDFFAGGHAASQFNLADILGAACAGLPDKTNAHPVGDRFEDTIPRVERQKRSGFDPVRSEETVDHPLRR